MDKDGFEILKLFAEKLSSMSISDKKKIDKIVSETGGTFKGAAWSFYQNKRYSPHGAITSHHISHPKINATEKRSKRQHIKKAPIINSPTIQKPYVKELKPGIRTIMFK
jgi:hypothetical protein